MSTEKQIEDVVTSVNEGRFEFKELELKIEKKSFEEISELAKTVDAEKAAEEVVTWLIGNVENFIDNKEREFRIDLIIEENSNEDMKNIKLLQDLYRAIPDDSESVGPEKLAELTQSGNFNDVFEDEDFKKVVACREELDNISFAIHDNIRESEGLKKLYTAMIYYYEMIGINNDGPLLKNLDGEVDVVEFEYEAFNVGVSVIVGTVDEETDSIEDKKVVSKYVIPEGFSLLLEIAFIDKNRSFGIF
jgi:hypothetical protein